MKIALIHDHLIQEGGAERVLQVFSDVWPEAPIYTLLYDKEKLGSIFPPQRVRPSFLQSYPGALKHYQWFLPLMPTATESYDLTDFDVVLSSSSAMAKGVITRSNTLHFCYCHTPTRYLWSDTHRYIEELKYPRLVKKIIPHSLTKLRVWDQLAAQRVDHFIANSKTVADRITKYYRRDSVIIHPPVDTHRFKPAATVGDYYLIGGRLVAYKRFDIAIHAFNRLGIKLKIFGAGPEEAYLRSIAKPHIEFLGKVPESDLPDLFAKAIAFIHPHVEDFGITAVESMAAGRPVIAYAAGGACETVVEKKTGKFFDDQTWESLADTVVRFKPEDYDPRIISEYAAQFGTERFVGEMKTLIEDHWQRLLDYQIKCGLRKNL